MAIDVLLSLCGKDASRLCEVSVNIHSTRWNGKGEGGKVAIDL